MTKAKHSPAPDDARWHQQAFAAIAAAASKDLLPHPDCRRCGTFAGEDSAERFVFGRDNWFDFEEVALAAATRGATIDLRVLDPDGEVVPLSTLEHADLELVRDVISSAWHRCGGEQRPSSLPEHAFDHVCHDLRHVLRYRVERELEHDDATPKAALVLPPPTHPWFAAGDRQHWWLQHVFGRGHLEAVRDWLVAAVASAGDDLVEERWTWLRTLAQRVAAERHDPDLLDRLRELYEPTKQRKALIAADNVFADGFDLTRYGGPWSTTLGLLHDRGRRRPFAIGEAKPATGAADVTVLIPSYRHGHFIAETLRSVLAQSYGDFRVLVADDRSPDDTVEVARSVHDDRIEVRVNEQNVGLGNSVLQALETIDTPYVALLNSDDLFHPDRLARCRDVLESHGDVQLVTTGITLVDQNGGQLTPQNASLVLDGKKVFDWVQWFDRVTPPEDLPQEELFAALLERNFLVTSSNLVARTDWLRAQADSLRSLKYCLDWQLFLQAALEGTLHHLHEPLIAYRLHATNTVWFREGRRWSYYLEVNRVAAEAIQRFVAQDRLDAAHKLEQVVDSVSRHLATNTEMDGLALFLNAVLDALQLDEATATQPHVQELIEQLNVRAEELREAHQQFDAEARTLDEERRDRRETLGKIAAERLQLETSQRQRLQEEADSLAERLQSANDHRDDLEAEKKQLYRDQQERIARVAELEATIKQLYADQKQRIANAEQLDERIRALYEDQKRRAQRADELEATIEKLYADQKRRIEDARQLGERLKQAGDEKKRLYDDQKQRIEDAKALQERIRKSNEQVAELRAELTANQRQRDELRKERDELRQSVDRLSEERTALQGELEHERSALAKARSELEQSRTDNAELTAQVERISEAKRRLEEQRNGLLHQKAQLQEEIARLLETREFRTGNFIWNKLPLGYMSRRGKKWYRRLLDAKDRAKMMFGSKRKKAEGTAVVAACWQWPIYSHTFVYQEMISLRQMGLDVKLFHWDLGSTDQLHAAFQYLFDNRTQLQPVWENHKKDKEHFEKTRPGKLRSFLERISPLCGKSVEELEKEPIVMQGCTFARMAELAGARYLHSYFFYDQSFMAMQAAWLLDLPRGVSCYADHMMDDYPWKFVPLHVELCDVIVATSARIKRELSELSGGKFDDKIIVKPNGVDGQRFPSRDRPQRKGDEPFEVLSVSRIEPKKGLTYLVEAIDMLKKRGHTVIAHIIGAKDEHSKGSLEYAAEFEQCIAEHGLEDQVILHGMMKQEQMAPLIEKSRAFVAPYVETESGDKDGIPTAMLEALASSLPVITTNSGSIVEVIDDGVEGIVVGQRDSAAFADALEKVITDPSLEQRMAKDARARFDRDFDCNVTEQRLHERIAGFLAEKAKA